MSIIVYLFFGKKMSIIVYLFFGKKCRENWVRKKGASSVGLEALIRRPNYMLRMKRGPLRRHDRYVFIWKLDLAVKQ